MPPGLATSHAAGHEMMVEFAGMVASSNMPLSRQLMLGQDCLHAVEARCMATAVPMRSRALHVDKPHGSNGAPIVSDVVTTEFVPDHPYQAESSFFFTASYLGP